MLFIKDKNDFTTTVEKALDEIDDQWRTYQGTLIVGSHTPTDVESKLFAICQARENNTPFLGICFGHQLAAIEYARNVLGIKDATSEEFGQGTFIVKKLLQLNVGLHDGESYWNNYEVDQEFETKWEKADNFITVQYHPEYQSSKERPHPILIKFINVCKKKS